jgi:hypothetical protein
LWIILWKTCGKPVENLWITLDKFPSLLYNVYGRVFPVSYFEAERIAYERS